MLEFFNAGRVLLDRVEETQAESIREAADLIAGSLMNGGVWHVFGTGHSHFLGEEVYYRAGGLAPVNAILFPALMQHEGPATSTQLERMPGLAKLVLDKADARRGEVRPLSQQRKKRGAVGMALTQKKGAETALHVHFTNQGSQIGNRTGQKVVRDLRRGH